MFTPAEREGTRNSLIEWARGDERITGCAITGSKSVGKEDRLSDIDLGFGVRAGTDLKDVIESATQYLVQREKIAHFFDIPIATWVIRVFFLENTLQIDLAFAPASDFCAISPSFQLQFGECVERPNLPPPEAEELIGWAWLHAIHIRSSISRNKFWQAEYMISGMRDGILALACLRHEVEVVHGRGYHLLPLEDTEPLEASLVGRLHKDDLMRAFKACNEALVKEIGFVNTDLRIRLGEALTELYDSTS